MDRQTIDRPQVKSSPPPRVLESEINAKPPAKHRPKRRTWLWILILIALCVVGYFIYARVAKPATAKSSNAGDASARGINRRSEEHTSELQSRSDLVCRLLLEKKKTE